MEIRMHEREAKPESDSGIGGGSAMWRSMRDQPTGGPPADAVGAGAELAAARSEVRAATRGLVCDHVQRGEAPCSRRGDVSSQYPRRPGTFLKRRSRARVLNTVA